MTKVPFFAVVYSATAASDSTERSGNNHRIKNETKGSTYPRKHHNHMFLPRLLAKPAVTKGIPKSTGQMNIRIGMA
jgi:hypothetical protein